MGEQRTTAVTAVKRNGAWMLSMVDLTGDATPDQLYEVASGLDKAKRIGKAMAEEFGYEGPFRWRRNPDWPTTSWDLRATWEDE